MVDLNADNTKIYKKLYGGSYESKNHDLFPKNVFMILAGSTGCGKTNLMINIIMRNLVYYNNIMIYTTTPDQDAYKLLRDYITTLKNETTVNKDITFYNPEDGIAHPSTLDKNQSHIIVFDDVMNEKQTDMTNYFCQGRHNNVNAFYLCQSIHHLKKHGIRQNANIFILFHQDKKTLKYFYDTHICGDMPFEEFEKICKDAWKKKHSYIVINLWEESECGRYLLNYNKMYTPEKYLIIPNNT